MLIEADQSDMANGAGATNTTTSEQVFDFKTSIAIEGLPNYVQKQILTETSEENRNTLVAFLYDLIQVENRATNTKMLYAKNLMYLLRATNHSKTFKQITRDELMYYLHSLRKPLPLDPDQKWIATYNNRAAMYQKFYKWLYYPELTADERPTPDIVKDIPIHKRKERTNVKAKDLWTPQEDALFLSYCEDKRIQFYHMFSLDTSARPHEGVTLRIGDIKLKYAGERQYAEVEIGRGGKTKSRTVPLIISLPFYKALLAEHPERDNPSAYIFKSYRSNHKYKNKHITRHSLSMMYWNLKRRDFPKLLQRPDIPPEEKAKLQDLLQKPWNPYIRRHTSLTQKARILNEYSLRLHAGWTKTSKMVEIYTHEFGNESSDMLLEAAGIKLRDPTQMNVLHPKVCTNCNEPNRPTDVFCTKCKFALNEQAARKLMEEQQAEFDQRVAESVMRFMQDKTEARKIHEDKDFYDRLPKDK